MGIMIIRALVNIEHRQLQPSNFDIGCIGIVVKQRKHDQNVVPANQHSYIVSNLASGIWTQQEMRQGVKI